MRPIPFPSGRSNVKQMVRRSVGAVAAWALALSPSVLLAGEPVRPTLSVRPTSPFAVSLFSATAPPAAPAPEASLGKGDLDIRSLTRDFLKDAGRIWSYPLHVRTKDVPFILGLAAATGFAIANDETIAGSFQDFHDSHPWVQDASPVITKMGSWGAWATAGLFFGAGLIAGDHKAAETGVLAATAMAESSLLVWFLKGMTGRQRPSYAGNVDHWSGPAAFFKRYESGNADAYDAMPSGHTITAFSLATVVAMEYQETVWVPILSYAVATGVGLSRVTMSRHWLSDVLVGGALGHLIGRLVVRNHRRWHHAVPALAVSPRSVSLTYSF